MTLYLATLLGHCTVLIKSCNYFWLLTSPENGTDIHRNIMFCYFPERQITTVSKRKKKYMAYSWKKLLWIFPNGFNKTFINVSSHIYNSITAVLSLFSKVKLTKYWNVIHLSYIQMLIQLPTVYSKWIDRHVEKWFGRWVGSETTFLLLLLPGT